jgi:hypothetical protein
MITLPLGVRLPTIYNSREYVDAGGLMSHGPNFPDLFRRDARRLPLVDHHGGGRDDSLIAEIPVYKRRLAWRLCERLRAG